MSELEKAVQKVNIREKLVLYKNGEPANSIELVKFNFEDGEECEFTVVSQKGLYEIGDSAFFFQPDYCLTQNSLFSSFIAPEGNPSKSRLGKMNRIRAIKFNFSLNEYTNEPVYSVGILLPKNEVINFLKYQEKQDGSLSERLGIFKYEEPEKTGSGMSAGDFPGFMYKTDEDNISNQKKNINRVVEDGDMIAFTIKRDGSSWTGYNRKFAGERKTGVCSRSLEKKIEQKYTYEYVDQNGNVFTKYFSQELKMTGWYCESINVFYSNEEITQQGFLTNTKEVHDSWIDIPKKYNFYETFPEYCEKHNIELALRGEIIGSGLKGSGNKHNPDSKLPQQLVLFGVDDLSTGAAIRLNNSDEFNLARVAIDLGIPFTEDVLQFVPTSFEDVLERAKKIFDEYEANGVLIEGIVARTMFNNKLSVKIMSNKYDEKK